MKTDTAFDTRNEALSRAISLAFSRTCDLPITSDSIAIHVEKAWIDEKKRDFFQWWELRELLNEYAQAEETLRDLRIERIRELSEANLVDAINDDETLGRLYRVGAAVVDHFTAELFKVLSK